MTIKGHFQEGFRVLDGIHHTQCPLAGIDESQDSLRRQVEEVSGGLLLRSPEGSTKIYRGSKGAGLLNRSSNVVKPSQ